MAEDEVKIFVNRKVVMQAILDAVQRGNPCWCAGAVAPEKCERLIRKFSINYQVDEGRNGRARRKRNGLGNAQLILWWNRERVYWWLFVTSPSSGEHAAHAVENLKNAMSKEGRIQLDGFELVQLPKVARKYDPQLERGKEFPNLRWTWRMSAKKYEDWRISIIDSMRQSSSFALHQLIYSLWSSPGFSGVRSQIGKLAVLYRAEAKRSRRSDAPSLPKKLIYIRRLRHDGLTLLQLLASIGQQRAQICENT